MELYYFWANIIELFQINWYALSWMCSFCCSLPRRNKDWVTEKSTLKNLCEGHHFFDCTPSFLCYYFCFCFVCFFFAFFVYSFHLPKWRTYWMAPIKIHDIVMDSIHSWRYHEWTVKNMKIFCDLILAGCHLQESDIIPDIVTRNG